MMVRWTVPALRDLEESHAYFTERDPDAALRIARLLRAQADGLGTHPQIGHIGRIGGTRELVVSGSAFIIAYRLTETTVDMLTIRHGARRWTKRIGD